MRTRRGSTLTEWALPFTLLLAVLMLLQVTYKRVVQRKVVEVTDFILWTNHGSAPEDYKGTENSVAKSRVIQQSGVGLPGMERIENKQGNMGINANIAVHQSQHNDEHSAWVGVDESVEPVLKSVDMNKVVP